MNLFDVFMNAKKTYLEAPVDFIPKIEPKVLKGILSLDIAYGTKPAAFTIQVPEGMWEIVNVAQGRYRITVDQNIADKIKAFFSSIPEIGPEAQNLHLAADKLVGQKINIHRNAEMQIRKGLITFL